MPSNRKILSLLRHAGFSLIELMVAMLLSLLLLAGVITVFASSRKTYEATDQLSRIQESGRFALDMIVRDLRGAGFVGCRKQAPVVSALRTPNSLLWNFSRPIEGFDAQGGGWVPTLDSTIILSASPDGDAIAIRAPRGEFEPLRVSAPMASPTSAVEVDAAAAAAVDLEAGDIVQISDCSTRSIVQLTSTAGGVLEHADAAPNAFPPGNSPGNSTTSAAGPFGPLSEVVAMNSVVYFLRTSTSGSGLSLWRRVGEAAAAEEVVEGVESLQFQYGEDTNNDTEIRVEEYKNADEVADWNEVLSVRIALLVRSTSEYGTDLDERTYTVLDQSVVAPSDRRLRQVFSTTVTIRNSAT